MEALYKICFEETVGRHLVSTQDIKKGTIILKEGPLVRAPFFQTYPVCLSCYKVLDENNSRPCSKCGWPVCDETCEKNVNHTPECLLTAARGSQISIKNFGVPNPNYQFVAILRALHLRKTPQWEKLITLQSHPIANIAPASFIKTLFKLEVSEEEIRRVAEILTVNGHELPLTRPPQLVVYENASIFEHSCIANCSKTFTNEGEVLVVATQDIEQGDHLSICYTDPFWGVENRREHLHQTKEFWCNCARCQDPTDSGLHLNSIICPHSSCKGFIYPKTFLQTDKMWICEKCDGFFSDENISLLLARIGAELAEMPKNDVEICKNFIDKYSVVLGTNHFYILDVKMALSHMLSSENFEDLSNSDLELLLKITQDLIPISEKVSAGTRCLGLMWYRLAKCKIESARRREDDENFKKVLKESKGEFFRAQKLLINEPSLLPEGRIYLKIGLELNLIDNLLNTQ